MSCKGHSKRELPSGVTWSEGGKVQVVAAARTGKKGTVKRVFTSVDLALEARQAAIDTRARGEDVGLAMDAVRARAGDRQPEAATPAAPRKRRANALTFEKALKEFQETRWRISNVSDHSRSTSKNRKSQSLRPTTLRSDDRSLNPLLAKTFGSVTTLDLDRAKIQAAVVALAEEGYSEGYQDQFLRKLRQIVGQLGRSDQPDAFPWRGIRPIAPATPMRVPSDPAKWGGFPGDPDPVVTFASTYKLMQNAYAADRAVAYLMAFSGLRRGEAFGLQLRHLTSEGNDGWVEIRQTRDLVSGELYPWVKTDSSYRRIPLAPSLWDYLQRYVRRYHGVALDSIPVDAENQFLIVNPAGRDIDGGWLPGLPSAWASRWTAMRDQHGYAPADRGFWFDPHHLRKSFSTYLLHADEICAAIAEVELGPRPDASEPDALVHWLEARLDAGATAVGFHASDVSAYLGHLHDTANDDHPASAITLSHYHLQDGKQAERFSNIARAVDRIIRTEIGSIVDEPDERDLIPVLSPSDDEWISTYDAAAQLGMSQKGLLTRIRSDGAVTQKMWRADGGHTRSTGSYKTPALPIVAVLRKEITKLEAFRSGLGPKAAGRLLGISPDVVIKQLVASGALPCERSPGGRPVIPKDAVEAVQDEIHRLVLDALDESARVTVKQVRERIDWERAPFGRNERPKEAWVVLWLRQLVDVGSTRRYADGRYARVPRVASRRGGRSRMN